MERSRTYTHQNSSHISFWSYFTVHLFEMFLVGTRKELFAVKMLFRVDRRLIWDELLNCFLEISVFLT